MPDCGAKTRSGTRCKRGGMRNGRCNLHGGKTPPTNKNAVTHGIYAIGLRDDEKAIWHEIQVGNLDDEIKLAKVQLRRALRAQMDVEGGNLDLLELTERFKTRSGSGKKAGLVTSSEVHRRPDYWDRIHRLLGRIGDLEAKRATITPGEGRREPHEWAQEIQDALNEIEKADAGADA